MNSGTLRTRQKPTPHDPSGEPLPHVVGEAGYLVVASD
jgi:hypothetical protein